MRLITLVVFSLLLLTAPASAQVTNVTVDHASPSAATSARTVYRVGLTVSAALSGSDTVRVALPGDAGAGQWQSGTLRNETRGADVGSCAQPNAQLTSVCNLFSSAVINAGDRLLVTLRGITNPPTPGNRSVAVSTTAEPQLVNSSVFNTVSGGQVTQPTVAIANPSAAAGALTRYVIGFAVSAGGGLSGEAGSSITVTLPPNTGVDGWVSGTIRDVTRNADVGTCARPVSGVSTCAFFSSGVVGGGDQLELTLRGLTNAPAGAKTLTVSTTSDLPSVESSPFQVVGGGAISAPAVGIASPSAATGALTRYLVGFRVSATGGLSGEAGSSITATLPAQTGTDEWQSGTLRNVTRNVDVGSCPRPTNGVTRCTFFSSGFVDPNDDVQLILRGLTNGPAGTKTASVVTSTDLTPVSSAGFDVIGGGSVSVPTVSIAAPSPATGALTRYVVGFRASATGGMSGEAGSSVVLDLPAGTGTTGWQSGTLRNVTRATDVGSCPQPTAGRSRCTFFSSGFVNPGDELQVILRGLTNGGVGDRTLAVSTSSDVPSIQSGTFTISGGGTLADLTVRAQTLTPQATTRYLVRFRVSATGGLSGEAGSLIRLTFPAGTAFTGFQPGTVTDTTRAVVVGSCGTPTGLVSTCAFFSAGFVNPGDVVQIGFPAITNPPTAGTLRASTTSDTPAVDSGPYETDGGTVEPTPTPTVEPTATPTAIATTVPTAVTTPTPTPAPDTVVRGTVQIKLPGSNKYVELDPSAEIPLGSTVDTKKGAVRIGQAEFYDGIFKLSRSGGVTVLTLTEPLAPCPKGNARASASKKKAKTRKLWGKGKGAFRTQGKYSAATVRGTTWLVQDSCSGTLTRVTEGTVAVRDDVKKKTVVVRAGKRYTARVR